MLGFLTSMLQWDTQTALIFIATFLIAVYLFSGRKKLPPGPYALPVVGNMIWFKRLSRSKKRLGPEIFAMAKEYNSKVVRLKAGSRMMIFIVGYDMIHDCLVKQSAMYSNRPPYLPSTNYNVREGRGVIWQSGQKWKVLRKFALQSLRDFGLGKSSLEEKVFDEINAATEFFKEKNGTPADIRALSSMMITNVIYRIIFGKRFEYTDGEFHDIIEHLDGLFKANLLLRADRTPKFINRILNRQQVDYGEERVRIFEWIRQHVYTQIKQHEETFDADNIRDFVDIYLEAKQKEEDSDTFTVGNIFRIILDLFIAGSETTSNTINWTILYMIEHPDCQKKCRDELIEYCGDSPIAWSDRGKMVYVEATLLEIQRLANIAEFSLPHTNDEDTYIDGYFIPKHSMIQANLYSSNMDPAHWDQPHVFNPDRFIEDGKLKKNPALIPFSVGPRTCMGESLARLEIFLIFTNLIQRFVFKRENDAVKNSFDRKPSQATGAPLDYMARAIPRE